MPAPLEVEAPLHVYEALSALSRTEDLAFSPSNRRLAIAEFGRDRIFLLDIDAEERLATGRLVFTDCLAIASPDLHAPHGLTFLDEDTIVVANRSGAAPVFELPPAGHAEGEVTLTPLRTLRGGLRRLISTPGSVAARDLGDEVDVLICNNYRHTLTRHRLDRRSGYRTLSNAVLLRAGLAVPDGVTFSPDGRWIAVSNHVTHSVLMFENTPELDPDCDATGALLDVDCPHGLRFSDDGRHLLVASAGAPFVHVYTGDEDGSGWYGDRLPVTTFQVMDQETFLSGRSNPEEGGPKGLDLSTELNLLAVTCEAQLLAFFDLALVLEASAVPAQA